MHKTRSKMFPENILLKKLEQKNLVEIVWIEKN